MKIIYSWEYCLFAMVQSTEPRINTCPFLSHGLFLTCRGENIFYFTNKISIINLFSCMHGIYKYLIYYLLTYLLTWNDSSLSVAANFRPCWHHAQSQLPHFRSPNTQPLLSPPFPPLPTNTCKYYNTDDINMPESSSVGYTVYLYCKLTGWWPNKIKKQSKGLVT
jgi:hypothetical protein